MRISLRHTSGICQLRSGKLYITININYQIMLNSKIIITVILLLAVASPLTYSNTHKYQLIQTQKYQLKIQLQRPRRVKFIQYEGTAHLIIRSNTQILVNTSSAFHQFTLTNDLVNSLIQITVTGSNAVGLIDCQPVEQFEMLKMGDEKIFHIRKKEKRIVEIHPRQLSRLSIQKIQGTAIFTNNRCKLSQKIDCFNQLQRIGSLTMSKTIQIVQLQYCSSCIILIKIQSESQQTKVRLSLHSSITVLNSHPTFSVIKQDQVQTFIVYGEANKRGKIINFAGSVSIESNLSIDAFTNGIFYQLDNTHKLSDAYELKVKGQQKINYFSVQAPLDQRIISLRDGCPSTIKLEPGITYTILFQHRQPGIGNFVVSGQSFLMNRLLIHFNNKQTNQNYAVRPRFLFDVVHGSQNFQLDNTTGVVQVQLKVTQGYGGYVNISAQVNEPLNLPFDWVHASILNFDEVDRYAMNGISGPVQIVISKCVECHIQLKIWSTSNEIKTEQITQRQTRIPFSPKNGQIFIQVTTNNYGFYSIFMEKKNDNKQIARLPNTNVSVYLTEPDSDLQLQFQPPMCGKTQCQSPKYYLIQGSDPRNVAVRSFCPNILFDFQEKTKDIIFQQIDPQRTSQNLMSFTRPLQHRDWLVIVAEANQQILSYDLVNSGEVRLYKSLRWPIFYFVMFITMAVFLSFVLFMGLRKRKLDASGYIRGASLGSTQDLN